MAARILVGAAGAAVAVVVILGLSDQPAAQANPSVFTVGTCWRIDGGAIAKVLEVQGPWIRTTDSNVPPVGPTWVNTAALRQAQQMIGVC